jgi:diacylglycerol O-acyltransferase / wax synthase
MTGTAEQARVADPDLLVPGARRMRPDDAFMLMTETDATPMHVGALLILEVPQARKADFYDAIRRQIAERLPHTPLLVGVREAPDGYDSDVWLDLPNCDLDYHIRRVPADRDMDDAALHAFIADCIMQRLDMSRPPFEVHVLDRLTGDRCAIYMKVHHAITDGIGFQTILGMLSDEYPPAEPRTAEGRLPSDEEWRRLADERFAREAPIVAEMSARRKEALAALEQINADPARRRALTPTLKMSGPTSTKRAYSTVSIPLARVKALSKRYEGTINDMFLAIASSAVRRYLVEIDDLPETPIVINSARSYRRPEHGQFGNRIVALHPHLATDIADPVERLRAIQHAMELERARTGYDEAMLGQLEKPYGARDRRAKFAARHVGGASVLPGNITLSNVPGPAETRTYAGFPQIANFPTPLLGSGRFLNITSRRNGDFLDMGIMVDPTKVPDPATIGVYLQDAVAEYERLAGRM